MRSKSERRGGTHRRTSDKLADKLRAVVAMPEQVHPLDVEGVEEITMTIEEFEEERQHLEELIFDQEGFGPDEIATALRNGFLDETPLVQERIDLMSLKEEVYNEK